jgi:hypothetical protein
MFLYNGLVQFFLQVFYVVVKPETSKKEKETPSFGFLK